MPRHAHSQVPTCWVRRLMWVAGEYCLAACFSASRWSSAVTRLWLYLLLNEPSSPSFWVLAIPEWCLWGWHEPAEKEKSSHPLRNHVLNKRRTMANKYQSTDTLLGPRGLWQREGQSRQTLCWVLGSSDSVKAKDDLGMVKKKKKRENPYHALESLPTARLSYVYWCVLVYRECSHWERRRASVRINWGQLSSK